MSGHSKWANIKIKKGKTDAQRGSVFTKIGREIAVAVKAGGPDPNSNSKLRDVIAKAKQNNMPNDNINRSIKKASGELGGVNYESITYEGYGAGVAAFDFKGEGYCQLFYYASSGGSGGFGYFYVFDCSEKDTATVFDYKKFINEYSAKCNDGFVDVYSGNDLFVTYDIRQSGINCDDYVSYGDASVYVTELNFLEPVFVYSQNHYRLNAWQNVIVGAQINVVGRIITTLVYDKEKNAFVKGFSSVFEKQ